MLPLLLLTLALPLLSHAASLSVIAPPSFLPTLPSSTVAHLTALDRLHTAPIERTGRFNFRNLSAGSYLLTVHSQPYAFTPLRVDVGEDGTTQVFQTFHGIEWDNKGVEFTQRPVELQISGRKNYYAQREGFSPLSFLKNPMILLAVFSMAIMFGMPYLMENMDPETRAEFEEQQKKSPLTGGAVASNPLQNFDMAAWMAGTQSKPASTPESDAGMTSGSRKRG
ncbi:MAG: hypothetical protein M1832_005108 [Thelocarpon impressellum]|nr:MAG: hypothetical protein M1832_005108 [Thelocarpon impressellum]